MSATSEHLDDMEHMEHIAHLVHDIPAHVPAGRARGAVLLLIMSDTLSVIAILVAGGYLNALNVENQYRISGDHPPTFLPGLLIGIGLLISGIAYYFWERNARRNNGAGQTALFVVSLVLMAVTMVAQIWMSSTLGYGAPFHAYESLLLLVSWFSSVHLVLATILGVLMLGRVFSGRLIGHTYIAETAGYWWYYTIISTLALWIFSMLI